MATTTQLIPGHPSLLPNIHAALHAAFRPVTPTPSPIDPIILQALITCIVARDTHLIIRTPDEDISSVARLVVWFLSSLFDYSSYKHKIRPRSLSPSPDHFLRSLFFLPSASQDDTSDPNNIRRPPPRRSRPFRTSPIHVDSTLSNVSTKSSIYHNVKSSSTVPAHPETSLPHHNSVSPNLIHPGITPLPQFPRALVISGLENASTSSQRALAHVLAEKRITFDNTISGQTPHDTDLDVLNGTWPLPDGFITVYICSLDPRERPNLHNALLDQFAMSCSVLLRPHVRHALQPAAFSSQVPRNNSVPSSPRSTTHTPLPSPHGPSFPTKPPVQVRHSQSQSCSHFPTLSSPILSSDLIAKLRHACTTTYLSPTLSLYLADLFSATRHHAQIDGTLLTARCVSDADKLARAARVVGIDPTGVELLRSEDDPDHNQVAQNEDFQWQDTEDEFEIVVMTDSLRISTGSVRGNEIQPLPADTRRRDCSSEEPKTPVLDVTEVNIARMFPRCVSHRLRVRDAPREEVLAGAVFGATFGDTVAEETGEYVDAYEVRPTVKDILVSVMSEV